MANQIFIIIRVLSNWKNPIDIPLAVQEIFIQDPYKMLSGDSGQGESICTPPHCVSKRLFGVGGSSSKKSLFGKESGVRRDTDISGEESDLGPMSPLDLTDRSEDSCDSSPGRSFMSPFSIVDKSSYDRTNSASWDRLKPNIFKNKADRRVSFDALRSLTRVARSSPKRKIVTHSPKSLQTTPRNKSKVGEIPWLIGTPEREIALLFEVGTATEAQCERATSDIHDNDDRIEETPRKRSARNTGERKLATPLSCIQKNEMVVPRLHRRKSQCPLEMNYSEVRSPERKNQLSLKRRANDSYVLSNGAKIAKVDANPLVPRARASLFRETKNETNDVVTDELTFSTESFYKSAGQRARSLGIANTNLIERTNIRHSLPFSQICRRGYYRRYNAKRGNTRHDDINAGVRHGIKRPKSKCAHLSRVEAFKRQKKNNCTSDEAPRLHVTSDVTSPEESVCDKRVVESPLPSPIADPNKRFFKTNRTLKSNHVATVTVNNNIKLKVFNGKIALSENKSQMPRKPRKKARLEDIAFDANDLTVDEPNFDASMEKKNVVDDILKVLEDDWADDEYDTMETLTIPSPNRPVIPIPSSSSSSSSLFVASSPSPPTPNNVIMSPGSVLSNMTLSMNIKDSCTESKTCGVAKPETRLYPLFTKRCSSNITDENTTFVVSNNDKKSLRGAKRSWQTSAKGAGADNQYQIDAGQKRFGATTCNECGIVYHLGDPEDENTHLNYHNNVNTLKFNGWKNERVIVTDPFTNSRIILIEPGDSKQCWKKVEQVLAVVDNDLGLADAELSTYLDKKVYFYVREKAIVGVMVAESIKTAHRMIPEFADLNCCSEEKTPAKCGINVIWTAMNHRRKHIATKLLDSLRSTYYFGYIMSLDDIAFSMPTPSGKIFAEKYTKTQNFKVYN